MYGQEQDEYIKPEIHEMPWRARAKELGIRMYRRKKVDVLADIATMEYPPTEKELLGNIEKFDKTEEKFKTLAEQPEIAVTPGTLTMDSADFNAPEATGELSITAIQMPEGVSVIEPVPEHPPWENDGNPTEVEGLMRRIETLENRFNRLIEAISKSKKVKGL